MRALKHEDKLYIEVFREIRSYIIRNNLKPGDQLPTEQAMCEMMGVSRNVLRESIKSMELMGMVSACSGRGTVVKEFNLDFVFQTVMFTTVEGGQSFAIPEMLEIRKRIELGYMRQAYAKLTPADVAAVRTILERIKECWAHRQPFHAEDRAFHMALFAPLGNKTLESLMNAIWSVDENFKVEEKFAHLDGTIDKHENIVRALEEHNEAAFEAAMMYHFATGKFAEGGMLVRP